MDRLQLSSVHCVFIRETLQNKGALHPGQAVSLSFTFQLNRNVCACSLFSFYRMTTSVLSFLITQTLTLLDVTFRAACPTKPVSSRLLLVSNLGESHLWNTPEYFLLFNMTTLASAPAIMLAIVNSHQAPPFISAIISSLGYQAGSTPKWDQEGLPFVFPNQTCFRLGL